MSTPKIEIIPIRPAVKGDAQTLLDVLVRITPPAPEIHFVRPPVNLALVLDRSGSMSGGNKMRHARLAATCAVEQLLPTDRVSVTIFDTEVQTIAPNGPVENKALLIDLIRGIEPRDSTDLHGGWKEGGRQASSGRIDDGLNRVILLSDGLANVGVTSPVTIATEVQGLAANGVSTTTMGLGADYNEDLMQRMGESGDGNYYFIENPVQLADIFATELKGLLATVGKTVSLGVEGQNGTALLDVLNDPDRLPTGRFKLPNLVVGVPISIVVRVKVPAATGQAEILRLRLAWDDAKTGRRTVQYEPLTLPAVASAAWDALPEEPQVLEQVAILMAARAKLESVAAHDRGDLAATRAKMAEAMGFLGSVPHSLLIATETDNLEQLQKDLDEANHTVYRKRASHQHYDKKRGL